MPKISAPDGTKLYYEEVGAGTPVVFVHEYAADYRTWEPQMRYFSRSHRCVTYSQRGYPPSDVPTDPARYAQDIARDDVIALMDALAIEKAHVVGHSMGAYTALHVGIRYPQRCLSVTAAGCGWGSTPRRAKREAMKALAAETGKMFAEEGIAAAAAKYADAPMRQTHKHKDPRGWAEFARMLAEHSAEGHALTMLNLQLKRPTLWEMESRAQDLQRAAARGRRRRGPALSRRQPVSQAHGADRGPAGDPALRPYRHQRGARRLQRGARGAVRGGGSRPLDVASKPARRPDMSADGRHRDHGRGWHRQPAAAQSRAPQRHLRRHVAAARRIRRRRRADAQRRPRRDRARRRRQRLLGRRRNTGRRGPRGTANAKGYDDLVEDTCRAIEAIAQPTIALIKGACMGAGVSVAGSCDLRVAADDAFFAVPAAKLGLGYDPRGIDRFIRIFGAGAARQAIFTGDRLPASRAYALGAVHAIAPAAEIERSPPTLPAPSPPMRR